MSKLTMIFVILLYMLQSSYVAAEEDFKAIGEKGIAEWKKGNLIEAMSLLRKSADKDYTPAQIALAYILDKSDDDKEAFELYKKAALKGNAEGQYGLSRMYLKGEGVTASQRIAGEWMILSARNEYVPAMRALALAYEFGTLGLSRNFKQASLWFHRCHEGGDLVCTRRLSKAYATGNLGIPVNMKKAEELYQLVNPKEKK